MHEKHLRTHARDSIKSIKNNYVTVNNLYTENDNSQSEQLLSDF